MDYICRYDSPLGAITLSCSGGVLTGLWFAGQKYFGSTIPPEYEEKDAPIFEIAGKWLDIYFGGHCPDFTPTIFLRGTAFQRKVWDVLLAIPYGKTMTYGQIADIIAKRDGGSKPSARAVGGAVGKNPVSLIVPCHRVIGADGSLTGYAGGIEIKKKLLDMERKNHGIL